MEWREKLKATLCRIAIDIQEHPEWTYLGIAAHIGNELASDGWTIVPPGTVRV